MSGAGHIDVRGAPPQHGLKATWANLVVVVVAVPPSIRCVSESFKFLGYRENPDCRKEMFQVRRTKDQP